MKKNFDWMKIEIILLMIEMLFGCILINECMKLDFFLSNQVVSISRTKNMKQEVFTFGSHFHGRLGHKESSVESLSNIPTDSIIDCTGGGNHSLFLSSSKKKKI